MFFLTTVNKYEKNDRERENKKIPTPHQREKQKNKIEKILN